MADTDMQLKQGMTWRALANETPLSEGGSHLNFLGMEEITLDLGLSLHRPFWNRLLSLFSTDTNSSQLRLVTKSKAEFNLQIKVKRTMPQHYTKTIQTNLPSELKDKHIVV